MIGLKIGFFAGKLISNVPFTMKRQCCQTNTWPSDSPGFAATEPSNIMRNQFISMKTIGSNQQRPMNSNSINGLSNKETINGNSGGTMAGSRNSDDSKTDNWKSNSDRKKRKKNRPINDDQKDDETVNNDDDWRTIDDDEDDEFDERLNKRKATSYQKSKQMKNRNKYYYSNDEIDKNEDKQIEDNLNDLDDEPNQQSFRQYSHYHPIYSSIYTSTTSSPFELSSTKNSHLSFNHYSQSPFYSSTNLPNYPYHTTVQQLYPTTIRNRKHYMLLTGK